MEKYFDFLKSVDGEPIPVLIKKSAQGKNISLRIDNKDGQVILTLPRFVCEIEGINFLKSKAFWVQKNLTPFMKKQKFTPNEKVLLLGKFYQLQHAPNERGGVWIENDIIKVSGEVDFFHRRVSDFIKRYFLEYAVKQVHLKSKHLGVEVGRVSLKDQKSRWGSCAAGGNISLSWRLALTPLSVAEYVIAHEVCHLREMNHGVQFWNLIYEVYDGNIAAAKSWLKENAKILYSYN